MTTINTNTSALITQLAMKRNERSQTAAMHQLSTGLRINQASDDAAGLAVVIKMNGVIKGLDQVSRNANDAIAMTETADGALEGITNILQRMRELAVQASTDTSTNRDLADVEFQSLKIELERIAMGTDLNDIKLLDGSSPEGFDFQIGTRREQTIKMNIPSFSTTGTGNLASVENSNLLTQNSASSSIAEIDTAIDHVLSSRADIGALVSRLRTTIDNLNSTTQNVQASRSEILDADYARASTELSRTQIIQEAATAILAQANVTQQQVLKLLQ